MSISFTSYKEVIADRHCAIMIIASIAARLPIGALSLAIILSTRQVVESFTVAGFAVSAFTLCSAALAPARGRGLDRFGIKRGISVLAAANTIALLMFATAILVFPNTALLITIAGLIGLTLPPVGQAVRTYWYRKYEGEALLSTAYALESVIQELIYIVGPLITGILFASGNYSLVFVFTAIATLVGSLVVAHLAGHADSLSAPGGHFGAVFRSRIVLLACSGMLGVGCALGVLDIALPAFAAQYRTETDAGILLSALAIGSAIGGIAFGARQWSGSLSVRTATITALFGLLLIPCAFASDFWVLGFLLAAAGLPLAATITCIFMITDRGVTAPMINEAQSWIGSAYVAGLSIGAAGGGLLLQVDYTFAIMTAASIQFLAAGIFLWTRVR